MSLSYMSFYAGFRMSNCRYCRNCAESAVRENVEPALNYAIRDKPRAGNDYTVLLNFTMFKCCQAIWWGEGGNLSWPELYGNVEELESGDKLRYIF